MSTARVPGPGGPVTLVSSSPDRMNAFAVGLDGGVYTCVFGTWGVLNTAVIWRRIGNLTVAPCAPVTAISRGTGLIDIFVVRRDGQVCTAAWDAARDQPGVFRGWGSTDPNFRAVLHAKIAVIAPSAGMIILFVIGHDGYMYINVWPDAASKWTRWIKFSNFLSPPGAPIGVALGGGNVDVFVVDTTGVLQWRNTAGVWAKVYSYVAFEPGTAIAAARRKSGALNIFFTLTMSGIGYLISGTNNGSGWTWAYATKPLRPRTPVTVAPTSDDSLHIFVTGADAVVYWTVIGAAAPAYVNDLHSLGAFGVDPSVPVGAVSRYWNTVQVAAATPVDGTVWTTSWTFGLDPPWTPTPWSRLWWMVTGMADPEFQKIAGLPSSQYVAPYTTVWSPFLVGTPNGCAGATSDGVAWHMPFNDQIEALIGTQRMNIYFSMSTGLPSLVPWSTVYEFPDDYHLGSPDYWEGKVFVPAYNNQHPHQPYGVYVCTSGSAISAGAVPAAPIVSGSGAKFSWCAVNPLNGVLYSLSDDMRKLVAFDPNTRPSLTRYPRSDVNLTYPETYATPGDQQGGVFTRGGRVLIVFGKTGYIQHMVCFSALTGRSLGHVELGRYGHTQDPLSESIGSIVGDAQSGTEVEGVTIRKITLPDGTRGDIVVSEVDNHVFDPDRTFLHLYQIPNPDLF